MKLTPTKKSKALKLIDKTIGLLEKCGGEGGTPGPCPTGGSGKPSGKMTDNFEKWHKEKTAGATEKSLEKMGMDVVGYTGGNWGVRKSSDNMIPVQHHFDEVKKKMEAAGWKQEAHHTGTTRPDPNNKMRTTDYVHAGFSHSDGRVAAVSWASKSHPSLPERSTIYMHKPVSR